MLKKSKLYFLFFISFFMCWDSFSSNSNQNQKIALLFKYTEQGNLEKIKELIKADVNINAVNPIGQTALHVASRLAHSEIIKELILAGASVHSRDVVGRTPLHLACFGAQLDDTGYLLSPGLKESLRNLDKKFKVSKERLKSLNHLILAGADVNATDKWGLTALDMASYRGLLEVTKQLVSAGADISIEDYNKQQALHFAGYGSHLELIKYLISQGADIHAKNRLEWTVLHIVASFGKLEAVRFFVEEELLDVNTQDSWGQTALHLASHKGDLEMLSYLVSMGADITIPDKRGMTALTIAKKRNNLEIVNYFASL